MRRVKPGADEFPYPTTGLNRDPVCHGAEVNAKRRERLNQNRAFSLIRQTEKPTNQTFFQPYRASTSFFFSISSFLLLLLVLLVGKIEFYVRNLSIEDIYYMYIKEFGIEMKE